MSRDANQIAQEAARREGTSSFRDSLQPPRPVVKEIKPKRGTLNVWTHLQDMKDGHGPLEQFPDVLVRLDVPGAIVMTSEEGSTYLLYPARSWYVEFIPNDEGE